MTRVVQRTRRLPLAQRARARLLSPEDLRGDRFEVFPELQLNALRVRHECGDGAWNHFSVVVQSRALVFVGKGDARLVTLHGPLELGRADPVRPGEFDLPDRRKRDGKEAEAHRPLVFDRCTTGLMSEHPALADLGNPARHVLEVDQHLERQLARRSDPQREVDDVGFLHPPNVDVRDGGRCGRRQPQRERDQQRAQPARERGTPAPGRRRPEVCVRSGHGVSLAARNTAARAARDRDA